MFPSLKVLVYTTSVQVSTFDRSSLATSIYHSKLLQHRHTLKCSANLFHQQITKMALFRLQSQEKWLNNHKKEDCFTLIFPSLHKKMSLSTLQPDLGSLITFQSVRGQSLGKISEQMTKLSVILKILTIKEAQEGYCTCCDIKFACQGRQRNSNSFLLCA